MRSENPRQRPDSSGSNPLQNGVLQIRRRLADLGPRTRLILGGLALALLVAAGYFASNPTVTEGETAWLFESQPLAPEDARRILAALATVKIPATPGPHGQIAVPASRKADALAALLKQKLLPQNLREIQDEVANQSIWAVPVDRGEQREQTRQRMAELRISELEGIESADVSINRSTSRMPGQKTAKLDATVRIRTIDGRPILHQTLQAIQVIIKNAEPDLPANALTVFDRSGKIYLDTGNPEIGAATMAHVIEEEIRSKILQELTWVEGIRVLVTMESPTAPEPVKAPEAIAPAIVMNAPAAIVDPIPAKSETAPTPIVAPTAGKARILIQVPISHYIQGYQIRHHHEATLDELKPYGVKVDESIRNTIQSRIPETQIASLKIDRIDAPGQMPPPIASAEVSAIRLPQWLIPAAAGASIALVILVLMGTRWMVARRPSVQVTSVPRAHFEVTDDAVPSGRVRELVRRDPAAAAGVLGRWIGQGGPSS